MASRKRATAPDHEEVRTSVCLARKTHARLSALASLRGSTINALIVGAIEDLVRELIIHDRRKPGAGDLSGQERESASDAA